MKRETISVVREQIRIVKKTIFRSAYAMVVWVGFCNLGSATTIVVIRARDQVVIAADSAGTFEGNNQPSYRKNVCKIYDPQDGRFFAVAGLVNDPATGFSVPHIVAKALHKANVLEDKLRAVEVDLKAALLEEIPHLKEVDSEGLAKLIRDKRAITVVYASIQSGSPFASGISLGITSQDSSTGISVTRDACPGNCSGDGRCIGLGKRLLLLAHLKIILCRKLRR